MSKMQAIEICAKAMLRRQGCEPAAWFQYPENTELAANIVTALEALGLLPMEQPEPKHQLLTRNDDVLQQQSNLDASKAGAGPQLLAQAW